jgi:hypothetical protein
VLQSLGNAVRQQALRIEWQGVGRIGHACLPW